MGSGYEIASNAELRSVQQFLDRCKKRGYISKPIDVKLLLNEQDKRIFNKVRKLENYPLYEFLPKIRNTGYNLRTEHTSKPKINSQVSYIVTELTKAPNLA